MASLWKEWYNKPHKCVIFETESQSFYAVSLQTGDGYEKNKDRLYHRACQ